MVRFNYLFLVFFSPIYAYIPSVYGSSQLSNCVSNSVSYCVTQILFCCSQQINKMKTFSSKHIKSKWLEFWIFISRICGFHHTLMAKAQNDVKIYAVYTLRAKLICKCIQFFLDTHFVEDTVIDLPTKSRLFHRLNFGVL